MQHLQTRAQFQAVMAAGIVARSTHFALHWRGAAAAEAGQWLGPLVPKRWARRSVTRHAIRRQIYAAGQAHASALPGGAGVVRLRAAFDRRVFVSASSHALKRAVRAELQQLFSTAARRLAQVPTKTPHT